MQFRRENGWQKTFQLKLTAANLAKRVDCLEEKIQPSQSTLHPVSYVNWNKVTDNVGGKLYFPAN